MEPILPEGDLFSMGQAARIVQVPDYTLRYWESRLRLLRPARRESGHRRYTREHLKLLIRLKDLVRDRRMTLAGARQVLLREQRGRRADIEPARAENGKRAPAPGADRVIKELRAGLKDLLAELSDQSP